MKNKYGFLTCLFLLVFVAANNANAAENGDETKIGVRLNPLLILLGGISAEVPVSINEHVAVAPMFAYHNLDFADTTSKSTGAGVRIDWHFNQAFQDGAYVSLAASYGDSESSITDNDKVYRASINGVGLGAIVGYLWRWDHVTFNIGIGAAFNSAGKAEYKADDSEVYDQTGSSLPITGDFSLGWAF